MIMSITTKITKYWTKAAETGSLRDKVGSSPIQGELGTEQLLLLIEGTQLRWFGHLIRTPPGRLSMELFQASKRPRAKRLEEIYILSSLETS